MKEKRLGLDTNLALRSFDLFTSPGRPPRQGEGDDLKLVEVSSESLLAAFCRRHPEHKLCKGDILQKLPGSVRVIEEWWKALRK